MKRYRFKCITFDGVHWSFVKDTPDGIDAAWALALCYVTSENMLQGMQTLSLVGIMDNVAVVTVKGGD